MYSQFMMHSQKNIKLSSLVYQCLLTLSITGESYLWHTDTW